jgi:hypothetical protein
MPIGSEFRCPTCTRDWKKFHRIERDAMPLEEAWQVVDEPEPEE